VKSLNAFTGIWTTDIHKQSITMLTEPLDFW
jgi:hypothetical protein